MMPFIITLTVILAISIGTWSLVRYIKRRTRQLFHTVTNGAMGFATIRQEELTTTPKSLSAMTRLMLPRITADFPAFSFDEMKVRTERVLTSYLRAIHKKDATLLSEGSDELHAKLSNYIAMLDSEGKNEAFDQIKIHRTEISNYMKVAGRCIVTFQSSVECKHYIEKGSQLITGSKDYKYQTRYEIDLIYIQDRDLVEDEKEKALAMNCPNCGAPLSSLGAKICEYCNTPLVEINIHAWTFGDIREG